MPIHLQAFFSAIIIGAGATLLLDLWTLFLKRRYGFPAPRWDLVGRWFAHMLNGRFIHREGIGQALQVSGELMIGWVMHYVVGICFAAILLMIWGIEWASYPTLFPALLVGWVTIGAGWFILQPGMGIGIACSKAANPNQARLMNFVGHTVFAIGMYGFAWIFLRA